MFFSFPYVWTRLAVIGCVENAVSQKYSHKTFNEKRYNLELHNT